MEAYQNATGLTDGEIDAIRQKSTLRYDSGIRIAEYAFNGAKFSGLDITTFMEPWNN